MMILSLSLSLYIYIYICNYAASQNEDEDATNKRGREGCRHCSPPSSVSQWAPGKGRCHSCLLSLSSFYYIITTTIIIIIIIIMPRSPAPAAAPGAAVDSTVSDRGSLPARRACNYDTI